jgi:hypothetical protein
VPRYSGQQAREAVEASFSYADALRRLGLRPAGGNHAVIRHWVDEVWRIPTDHFDQDRRLRLRARQRIQPLEEVLVERSNDNRTRLKRRLFGAGLTQPACVFCGQGEVWHGRFMGLILDHANGVADDNRLENLRILCPNWQLDARHSLWAGESAALPNPAGESAALRTPRLPALCRALSAQVRRAARLLEDLRPSFARHHDPATRTSQGGASALRTADGGADRPRLVGGRPASRSVGQRGAQVGVIRNSGLDPLSGVQDYPGRGGSLRPTHSSRRNSVWRCVIAARMATCVSRSPRARAPGATNPERLGEQLALLLDGASARSRVLNTSAFTDAAAIAAVLIERAIPTPAVPPARRPSTKTRRAVWRGDGWHTRTTEICVEFRFLSKHWRLWSSPATPRDEADPPMESETLSRTLRIPWARIRRFGVAAVGMALALMVAGGAWSVTSTLAAVDHRGPDRGAHGLRTIRSVGSSGTVTGPCAWTAKQGGGTLPTGLIGDLDADATYWETSWEPEPGAEATFQGTFPMSRYMSFSVYSLTGQLVTHLYDAQLTPDSGVNAFQSGRTGTGTYTVNVVAGSAPAQPASNTLYTGSNEGVPLVIVYRIYDSNAATDTGGVGLPSEVTSQDGISTSYSGCYDGIDNDLAHPAAADPVGATAAPAVAPRARADAPQPFNLLDTDARPDVTPGEPRVPEWIALNSHINNPNNFTDPDTGYLAADLYPAPDEVVVARIKVPTFPDTDVGQPVWTARRQVRYWSICVYYSTNVLSGCIHDAAAVTVRGQATFVISSTQPANATPADGINWLPLGSGPGNGAPALNVIVYRQILASSTFRAAIANVRSDLPILSMGSYYPKSAYCTLTAFEEHGVRACLR